MFLLSSRSLLGGLTSRWVGFILHHISSRTANQTWPPITCFLFWLVGLFFSAVMSQWSCHCCSCTPNPQVLLITHTSEYLIYLYFILLMPVNDFLVISPSFFLSHQPASQSEQSKDCMSAWVRHHLEIFLLRLVWKLDVPFYNLQRGIFLLGDDVQTFLMN